jgi:hypothetical protein
MSHLHLHAQNGERYIRMCLNIAQPSRVLVRSIVCLWPTRHWSGSAEMHRCDRCVQILKAISFLVRKAKEREGLTSLLTL